MHVRIDDLDPTPAYEQLRRQLLALVRTGALATGDRVPPIRQLAADLAVAPGTVARAYRELELAGVLHSRRGAGTRVQAVPVSPVDPGVLARAAAELVRVAHDAGADDHAVRAAVDRALAAPPAEPARGARPARAPLGRVNE